MWCFAEPSWRATAARLLADPRLRFDICCMAEMFRWELDLSTVLLSQEVPDI